MSMSYSGMNDVEWIHFLSGWSGPLRAVDLHSIADRMDQALDDFRHGRCFSGWLRYRQARWELDRTPGAWGLISDYYRRREANR